MKVPLVPTLRLLSDLPQRNDHAAWARLTERECATIDNARNIVSLGGRLTVDELYVLLAAHRRLQCGPTITAAVETVNAIIGLHGQGGTNEVNE